MLGAGVSLSVPFGFWNPLSICVGPSNVRELEIVLAVDRMAFEGELSPSAFDEIRDAVRFIMSKDDSEFLVN